MKTYGLERDQLEFLRKALNKAFAKKELPKVYIFGSRAVGEQKKNSDIDIALKGKGDIDAKVDWLKDYFEESDFPYKVDVVNWDKIIDDYKPSINKQKKLLWSPEQKKNTTKWRVCPIGEHWVRRHDKKVKSGKVGDWDGHCRKNPSRKDILKSDEIEMISQSSTFKNAKPKASQRPLGFPNENDYNELIAGWTAYWNSVFKVEPPLHPNYVKALIASESGFRGGAKARNKLKVGDAQGLVQLTEQTQRILKDKKGELKNHYIYLKKGEIWQANPNVAAAVRWLFRKREIAKWRLKREPTWEEVIWEYKGIQGQKHPDAIDIKKKYKEYLKRLNAKK